MLSVSSVPHRYAPSSPKLSMSTSTSTSARATVGSSTRRTSGMSASHAIAQITASSKLWLAGQSAGGSPSKRAS
ncbi:Uncharacterised protein [Mycobacteroides abscessus subsp. abscessus]|nr:Uncharacterised protein [Mycobacteroides abscessus subsp. abscessus]